jgi:hypothetical protein
MRVSRDDNLTVKSKRPAPLYLLSCVDSHYVIIRRTEDDEETNSKNWEINKKKRTNPI